MMSDAADMGNAGSPCQPAAIPLASPASRGKIDFGAQNYLCNMKTHRNITLLSEISDAGPQRNLSGGWGIGSGIPSEISPVRVSIIYPFDN
jgi:hypothetical protein